MERFPCYRDFTSLKKGSWSPEEDQKLKAYIKRYGIWNWTEMPKAAGLSRSGKSCRLRWMNYLKPGIKRGNFSRQEEETILKLHGMMGNRWSAIAERLPGRTDNEIKNYWHTKLRKLIKANNPAPSTKMQARETPTLEAKRIANPKEGGSMGYEFPWSPQFSIDFPSSSTSNLAVGADHKIQLEGISENPNHPYASAPSSSVTSPDVGTDKNQMMEGTSMESAGTLLEDHLQAFPLMENLFTLEDCFWGTWPDLGVGFPIFEEWVQGPLWTFQEPLLEL